MNTLSKGRRYNHNPVGEYFSLPTRNIPNSVVNMSSLRYDLQRGVKRLGDYAYCSMAGTTFGSLKFLESVAHLIPTKGVSAKMEVVGNVYQLSILLESGHTLVFRGIGSGYFGEGSRGAYDILKFCGFSPTQCNNVWSKESFRVYKRV